MRATVTIILLALLGGPLLAGCADDQSREREYARGVLQAERRLVAAHEKARPAAGDRARDRPAELQALADVARATHRDVRALEPPQHLRDEDRRILDALVSMEQGATRLAGATTAKDARAAFDTYLRGMVELDAELERLRDESGS
ncbi:MAG TPA: hypothetical protein VM364_13610 [Vicinamibacterales bacterium]|nr:hypothetical protein [Vicinamibacterales bacterium]